MSLKKELKQSEKIKKSKEIIKREKAKIKEEKRKIRQLKNKNSKLNKIIKKFFFIKEEKEELTKKEQVFIMIYFTIIGFLLCLLLLYALSGGKNYLKIYYELDKLIETYDTVISNYYGELSKEQLIDKAIDSMLDSIGDNYTTYSDIESTNTFIEDVEGVYEGIGCTVVTTEDNQIIISDVFEDGPAEKAGLVPNDIITKIDGEDFSTKTSLEVAEYIKTNNNNKIIITIIRENEEKEITVTRGKVELPTVASYTYKQDGKKIGYIQISIFSAVTTDQFKEALTKLEKDDKIDGLVIDVRDNSGGYLTTVTDITSMFLAKNKVIYQLQDDKETTKTKDQTKEHRTYPIAVLINQNSASASEILASAIKESYGGEVVGINSFGKGTVQKTKKLKDGSMIKYTVQNWLTPDGNWINEKGVTPTKFIELDTTQEEDNQLQEALEIIKGKIS